MGGAKWRNRLNREAMMGFRLRGGAYGADADTHQEQADQAIGQARPTIILTLGVGEIARNGDGGHDAVEQMDRSFRACTLKPENDADDQLSQNQDLADGEDAPVAAGDGTAKEKDS